MKFLKNKIFHPFLFAAFPALFLYAENVNMVSLQQVWIPVGIASILTAALLLVSRLLFRDWYKAALFTSGFIVLFFLYRPVFTTLQDYPLPGNFTISRNRQLLPFFLIPLAALIWFVCKSRKPLQKLTYVANITALILLVPSVLRVMAYSFQGTPYFKPAATKTSKLTSAAQQPDIFYFILDGYARQDILAETFKFNNRPFLNNLKQRGFYVAEKSTSNYCQTYLSVASALNYNYLPEINGFPGTESDNREPLYSMISENRVRKELKNLGYRFINFVSGISFTQIKSADHYFGPKISFNEYEMALFNTTPLPDLVIPFYKKDPYDLHRKTVLFPFQKLPLALDIQSPKFVFIHIVSPHPPFIFGPDGEEIQTARSFALGDGSHFTETGGTKAEYLKGYTNQLAFLNKQLLTAVDTILNQSETQPIIILQSDHGARLHVDWENPANTDHREAFSNLSAFYFPEQNYEGLYPEITPVNIFRIILNQYFKANLPLLPEKNLYSPWEKPYEFTNVTNQVRDQEKIISATGK